MPAAAGERSGRRAARSPRPRPSPSCPSPASTGQPTRSAAVCCTARAERRGAAADEAQRPPGPRRSTAGCLARARTIGGTTTVARDAVASDHLRGTARRSKRGMVTSVGRPACSVAFATTPEAPRPWKNGATASTRSRRCGNGIAPLLVCTTFATHARWVSITPLGSPLVPLEYGCIARSVAGSRWTSAAGRRAVEQVRERGGALRRRADQHDLGAPARDRRAGDRQERRHGDQEPGVRVGELAGDLPGGAERVHAGDDAAGGHDPVGRQQPFGQVRGEQCDVLAHAQAARRTPRRRTARRRPVPRTSGSARTVRRRSPAGPELCRRAGSRAAAGRGPPGPVRRWSPAIQVSLMVVIAPPPRRRRGGKRVGQAGAWVLATYL